MAGSLYDNSPTQTTWKTYFSCRIANVVRPWTDGHCNLCLSDEEDRNLPIGAIAGGAAAAAAVVVVVVVVVVIVVRRKRRKQPTNAGKGEDADTKDGKTCLICLCQ